MVRLSTAHLEIAKRAAADLFRYNRTAEAHAAILRTDPNRYAQVYEAYAASAPPLGFMPPPAAIDEEIKQGEQLLSNKVGCTEFIDHLAVLSTCVYLTRLIKTKLASISENVLLAAMREHTQLERQSPLVPGPEPIWPANPHPLLLGERLPPASPSSSQAQDNSNEGNSHEPFDPPVSMPAPPLLLAELQNKATVQVTPHLLNAWKRNPGVLQQKIFIITPEEGDLPSTAFRLHALLTIGKTRVFYLVFEGEGNEAVVYQDDVFFEMVGSAKYVS